jgi:hypothetical protein
LRKKRFVPAGVRPETGLIPVFATIGDRNRQDAENRTPGQTVSG